MAYDSNNPSDVAALKSEIINDPAVMGYADASGSPDLVATEINDPAQNTGAETINRPTEELDIPEISAVIVPAEYDALTAYDKEWVKAFINQSADVALKPFQDKFQDIFTASVTLTATLALRTKNASRAEVLFGVNTVITVTDITTARDS